jgi:hypothetical protein
MARGSADVPDAMRHHASLLTAATLALLVPAGTALGQAADKPAVAKAGPKDKDKDKAKPAGKDKAKAPKPTGATADPQPEHGADDEARGLPHGATAPGTIPQRAGDADAIAQDGVPEAIAVGSESLEETFDEITEPAVAGRQVQTAVAPDGKVIVRLPGAEQLQQLEPGVVPVGSIIDTRKGAIAMRSAVPGKPDQTAVFAGAVFTVQQGRDGYVDLKMTGGLNCSAGAARAAAASRKPKVRRLWGSDKGGRYRTHGRDSVATVRGTIWLVEETCAGTRTQVIEGAVDVRDKKRNKTVRVRAGHSYLARR